MFDNQYVALRIEKADVLRSIGKNPYTSKSSKTASCAEVLQKCEYLLSLEGEEKKQDPATYVIAGRIKFLRLMGKAAFAKIEDESGVLQVYYSRDDLEDWFDDIKKLAEVGDIVEIGGYGFLTKTGEITLHAKSFEILTKAVAPLPEKFHGLTDMETRYRQRYLDLIMNREVKETFVERSRIVSFVRKFFEENGYLEVETPMMHPLAGGATARPFVTHHNALGEDKFLRIAPELYLKRLVVGGFEAVFEINRNFRNEGMDHTHNPEFTMIEFYRAYKDFNYLMALSEELITKLLDYLGKPTKLEYGELEIDFSAPFQKISYKDSIAQVGGVASEVMATLETITAFLDKNEIEYDKKGINYGKALAELFDNFVEKKLINPTFITDFPVEISPLAKRSENDPEITDRFELFIAGKEIANGFNELNDPIDQYGRFKAQVDAKAKGDLEANDMDEDFIEALKYGMPPTAGEGIGIDRLVMLLTNNHSIKDVLLFPAMRKQSVAIASVPNN